MNNNMVIIENNKEFIPVYRTEQGIEVIDGRELYNNLPISRSTKFSDWIKDNLNNVDAIENIDFFQYKTKNPKGGRPRIEYILKLDIAKEICMITGANPNANEELRRVSKAYRKYFIESLIVRSISLHKIIIFYWITWKSLLIILSYVLPFFF